MKKSAFLLVFGVTFSTCFGPGCHLAPKPPKTPKRVSKMIPQSMKNHTGNQKNSLSNLHKLLHYILHLENKSSEPVGTRPGGMRVAL